MQEANKAMLVHTMLAKNVSHLPSWRPDLAGCYDVSLDDAILIMQLTTPMWSWIVQNYAGQIQFEQAQTKLKQPC